MADAVPPSQTNNPIVSTNEVSKPGFLKKASSFLNLRVLVICVVVIVVLYLLYVAYCKYSSGKSEVDVEKSDETQNEPLTGDALDDAVKALSGRQDTLLSQVSSDSLITVMDVYINNNSKYSTELLNHLRKNLQRLVLQAGLRSRIQIVRQADYPKLRREGIKKLPAISIKGNHFMGIPQIKNELSRRMRTKQKTAKPKSDEENLREHILGAIYEDVERQDGKLVAKQEKFNDQPDFGALVAEKQAERRAEQEQYKGNKFAMSNASRKTEREFTNQMPTQRNRPQKTMNRRQDNTGETAPKTHDQRFQAELGGGSDENPIDTLQNVPGVNKQDRLMMEAMLNNLGGDAEL